MGLVIHWIGIRHAIRATLFVCESPCRPQCFHCKSPELQKRRRETTTLHELLRCQEVLGHPYIVARNRQRDLTACSPAVASVGVNSSIETIDCSCMEARM